MKSNRHHERDDLETPARAFSEEPTTSAGPRGTMRIEWLDEEDMGKRIGRYKLLEKIGEGGCGTVYVAEQVEPVRRRVALKVIKLGMDTRAVVARFEAERQALAMMDHPNIAKVLDAGTTETGRPFFVMELVRGIRITDYCDQNHLNTGERLKLFIKVCQAIQHAHQKAIIHRDIKPSNIMVTLHDGVPVPKVIDFGIAKAMEGRLTDSTVYTQLHEFIGTPAYISPEQAEMSGLDIDTRSDIYSLGVLLYELLAGTTPFDPRELVASGIDGMRRTIRDREPMRPSTKLAALKGEELTTTAKRRSVETARLARTVRGDLDWIVMKCLEKDRARRYETANGLAADLARYLADEPVVARPPGTAYRLQKAWRRNRVAFGVAALIAAVMFMATGVSVWQAVRATRAENRANRHLADSESVSKFLTEVFQSPDPARDGRTITVAETLGKAANKMETDLASQPARRALLQATLGKTYHALGLYRDAIPLQEKARDYFLAASGRENPDTLDAMSNLARTYYFAGLRDEALKLWEEVLTIRRRVLGPGHPDTLTAMASVAISYYTCGRRTEALKLREEVFTARRGLLGPEHNDTINAMYGVAASYDDAGRKAEALKLWEQALILRRKLSGPEHPDTLNGMHAVALAYHWAGRKAEAVGIMEDVLALRRKILGSEHPDTLIAIDALAYFYNEAGRRDEVLRMRTDLLAVRRRVLGNEHPGTLNAIGHLADSLDDAGRHEEASKLRAELESLRRKASGA